MRRLLLLLGMMALSVSLSAQNNPYDIDDNCYELFVKAESLVGTEGFHEAGDAFLHEAMLRGDKKAQVLYYTCRLKNVIGTPLAVPENASPEVVQEARNRKNKEVLAAHEDLKRMARSMDYMQYFYYSYSLTKNYFYNNRMHLQAVDLLKEMREIAIEEDNAYGKWYSAKEMASIYQVLRDARTTRRYLSLLLKEYAETDDPTIKRQLIGSYYVDYAETFAPGSDSAKFYIDLAAMQESTVQDTVRYNLAYARYYAARGDRQRYKYYRDKCYDSPFADKIYSNSTRLMDCIDHMFEGKIDWNDVEKLPVRRLKVLEKQAEALGNVAVANRMKDLYIDDTEQFFATLNELHLEEMEARMGKASLTADLAKKTHQVEVTTMWISFLISAILVVILFFMLFTIRHLKKTNEKVRQADEAKTRFVQNMSHEVRTPLNAIVGFSQLLSLPDGSFPEAEKEEFAGHIVNNTKMLTMLLDDILNASAMDKGNYKITYEDGESSFICHSAVTSSEHRLQPGVKMLYMMPADARLSFHTDPQRVQQILINLLTNACKHTPSGEIRIGWEERPGFVDFYVEDTGPGIPADKAEAIFDRFTKLNDFVQGTGLGLSICREIADKMGGRVYLDTTYTSGARFILSLPLNPPA